MNFKDIITEAKGYDKAKEKIMSQIIQLHKLIDSHHIPTYDELDEYELKDLVKFKKDVQKEINKIKI